ncbi:cytoplasmic protein [candidate division KSB1 bacterium]|nr:cytoplasmic protein [candidate division KSB1 bacterium]
MKSVKEQDHIRAHKHCSRHRKEILASENCGCFYCLRIFPPAEIEDWIDDDDTALCPKCGIDSVIGSQSGFPITKRFLRKMHDHWFSIVK